MESIEQPESLVMNGSFSPGPNPGTQGTTPSLYRMSRVAGLSVAAIAMISIA
jgi:hypothetical protein